jgi:hypothetical protein
MAKKIMQSAVPVKPNGSSAPPQSVPLPVPPTGDVYKICGIDKKPDPSAY